MARTTGSPRRLTRDGCAELLPTLEQLIILPDTGHMGPLERPREINRALLELAEKVSPATPVAGAGDATVPVESLRR